MNDVAIYLQFFLANYSFLKLSTNIDSLKQL